MPHTLFNIIISFAQEFHKGGKTVVHGNSQTFHASKIWRPLTYTLPVKAASLHSLHGLPAAQKWSHPLKRAFKTDISRFVWTWKAATNPPLTSLTITTHLTLSILLSPLPTNNLFAGSCAIHERAVLNGMWQTCEDAIMHSPYTQQGIPPLPGCGGNSYEEQRSNMKAVL